MGAASSAKAARDTGARCTHPVTPRRRAGEQHPQRSQGPRHHANGPVRDPNSHNTANGYDTPHPSGHRSRRVVSTSCHRHAGRFDTVAGHQPTKGEPP